MKIKAIALCLAACLCLAGCGAKEEAAPSPAPTMDMFSFDIPAVEYEKTNITFRLNGTEETVPAYLYEGMDYTIAVPDGGWHMYEPGTWQATFNQKVKFWIKGYNGDNAKNLINELAMDGYSLGVGGSIMSRSSGEGKDKLIENVMVFRNGDSMRGVFYCYPEELAANFGVRLDTIVNTFSWKDPQANATSGSMAGLTDAELQDAMQAPATIIETVEGQSTEAAQIALLIASAEEKAAKLDAQLQAATSQTDMNITSAEIYQLWDDTINAVWNILRESMDPGEFNSLLDWQLEWIDDKEYAVQQAAAEFEGGSMASLAANQKASELTRERIYELAEYAK